MAKDMHQFVRFVLGLGAFLVIGIAVAQGHPDLDVVLEQYKIVVDARGKEIAEPAKLTKPGDVIEYVATYRNKGKSIVKDIAGILPVPDGMEYTGKKSGPRAFSASLDGQVFKVPPLQRIVTAADGRDGSVEVLEREFKLLRWQLGDLAPGKRITVSARMKLNPVTDPLANSESRGIMDKQ